jgi:hypothetical protein
MADSDGKVHTWEMTDMRIIMCKNHNSKIHYLSFAIICSWSLLCSFILMLWHIQNCIIFFQDYHSSLRIWYHCFWLLGCTAALLRSVTFTQYWIQVHYQLLLLSFTWFCWYQGQRTCWRETGLHCTISGCGGYYFVFDLDVMQIFTKVLLDKISKYHIMGCTKNWQLWCSTEVRFA